LHVILDAQGPNTRNNGLIQPKGSDVWLERNSSWVVTPRCMFSGELSDGLGNGAGRIYVQLRPTAAFCCSQEATDCSVFFIMTATEQTSLGGTAAREREVAMISPLSRTISECSNSSGGIDTGAGTAFAKAELMPLPAQVFCELTRRLVDSPPDSSPSSTASIEAGHKYYYVY